MKMAEQAPTLTRHDVEAKIVKRCWEDDAFRREFTADPAGAFVKYLGVPVASLPKVVVHEESAGWWHIVLPPKPANADELSEPDLERVAGGMFASAVVVTTIEIPAVGMAVVASLSGIGAGVSASVMKGW
jgi:hypothetical protein